MSTRIGKILGDYRIEQFIGEGGMSAVYAGRNLHTGRSVAIKLLRGFSRNEATLLAEAHSLEQLDHENIVRLLHCGQDPASGVLYLVLELATGGTLGDVIRRHRQRQQAVDLALALDLAAQAASGLAYAQQFVVHQDIKSDNLLLFPHTRQGESVTTLKISDFGLARRHRQCHARPDRARAGFQGTLAYAAPEQFLGYAGDTRSDIYALGVVCYELLTGRLPFDIPTGDLSRARSLHLEHPAPSVRLLRPTIPVAVETMVLRCLAKAPTDRPADAGELVEVLRNAMQWQAYNDSRSLQPDSGATALALPQAAGQLPQIHVYDRSGAMSVALLRPRMTIGRAPLCDLVLPSNRVSWRHLCLHWEGNQVSITDLESNNGTYLDGNVLPSNVPQRWPALSRLRVGPYQLRLHGLRCSA